MYTRKRKILLQAPVEYFVQLDDSTQTAGYRKNKKNKTNLFQDLLYFKWHKRFLYRWTEELRGNAGRPNKMDDRLTQTLREAINEDR